MGRPHGSTLPCSVPPVVWIEERRGNELSALIHSLLQDRAWPASRNPWAWRSRQCWGRSRLPVPFGGEGAPRRPGERMRLGEPSRAPRTPAALGLARSPDAPRGRPRPLLAAGARRPCKPRERGWGRAEPRPRRARSAASPGRPSSPPPSPPRPPGRAEPSRAALPALSGHHAPRVSGGVGGLPGARAGAHRDPGAAGARGHR